MEVNRMTAHELEMAQDSILKVMNEKRRCVRLGPGNTFKPEGEIKMSLTEFLAWARE